MDRIPFISRVSLRKMPALCALLGAIVPLLFAGPAAAAEPTFPELTGRVVDEAGILSASTREELTGMLAEHERATGQQVVVVTLKSLQGYDIADYGYRLGRHWGIGEKGSDTGSLLIVAPNEHKVRIEVGYGLEGKLTDAASRVIIEQVILPEFRRGDFNAGVRDGTAEMLRALGGTAAAPQPRHAPRTGDDTGTIAFLLIAVAWIILWRYLWPLAFIASRRGAWDEGRSSRRSGIWFGGFPGGFSGGGSSGGGFSGGGGSFGGGGASGSW